MNNNPTKTILFWVVVIIVIAVIVTQVGDQGVKEVQYSDFLNMVRNGQIQHCTLYENRVEGTYFPQGSGSGTRTPQNFETVALPSVHETLVKELNDRNIKYSMIEPNRWMITAATMLMPIAFILVLYFLFMRQMQLGGNKALQFGRSRAKLHQEGKQKVTFADVAGCDEAKDQLQEIIEFLKNPQKFHRLGGKIPKGVLLIGQPGTGKTLLARAVAGEADVPFYSISGSEFVEMFVGVGASRVRDLFEQAKKNAPSIVFIDEIDSVGRQRFAGLGGGHDEREQTLNQLLVEMDGFEKNEEVILVAATNRPDVLDPALLRPGRFDRQVAVDMPDLKGREEILGVHIREIKCAEVVDRSVLARRTPGFSGADLANGVNEAALLAARRGHEEVMMEDFEEAFDRVMAGPEKRAKVLTDEVKRTIAFHEAGHAIMHWLLDEVDPLHKVSILPRGQALGYTMHLPTEDKYLVSRKNLLGLIVTLLGGRAAEDLVIGEITTGAANDLQRATELAHRIVCEYGMSVRLGLVTFGHKDDSIFLGRDIVKHRDYSEEVANEIDQEVRTILDECYMRAKNLLKENNEKLHALAEALLTREVLDAEEVNELFAGPVAKPAPKPGEPPVPPKHIPTVPATAKELQPEGPDIKIRGLASQPGV